MKKMNHAYLVPFHGDKLNLIEHNKEAYVAVKPIAERLGLNWASQFAKLKAALERWGVAIIATPSAGGIQETVCIPISKVFSWLITINPKKVADKVRPALERYQAECDRILFEAWTGIRSRSEQFWREENAALMLELNPSQLCGTLVRLITLNFTEFGSIKRQLPNKSKFVIAATLHRMVLSGEIQGVPTGTPTEAEIVAHYARQKALKEAKAAKAQPDTETPQLAFT
jgi:P22_AR N-terminal domain